MKRKKVKGITTDKRSFWKPTAKDKAAMKSGNDKIREHYKKEESNGLPRQL